MIETPPLPPATARAAAAAAALASADELLGPYADVPHSNIRRIVASRLLESKQTVRGGGGGGEGSNGGRPHIAPSFPPSYSSTVVATYARGIMGRGRPPIFRI